MTRGKATKKPATKFEYDAVVDSNRRRKPYNKLHAEHVILPQHKRKKLLATVQDQVRNSSMAAWMIRRHLDYVSQFKLQFRSGNEALDSAVYKLFHRHARPSNFDIAGRLGREEMFRMFELEKVVSGDAAMIKLEGGKLQAIESDLIAYPQSGKWDAARNEYSNLDHEQLRYVNRQNGVVMDAESAGRVAQYCICNRGQNGMTRAYDHLEQAENVIFDAYYTRYSSQVRGVSPLATAINAIQDLYEGIDYALAKAKIHSLFGLAIMRDYATVGTDQEEVNSWGGNAGVTQGADANAAETEADGAGLKAVSAELQKITPQDMIMMDMDVRGRIETIESRTPSTEFQSFTDLVVRIVMLSLDIPFSAYNPSGASFSSLIADQNLYEIACRSKRQKNKWKRQEYSDWLIEYAWSGRMGVNLQELASQAGISSLMDLQELVEWVPSGTPWLQKLQEVQGDMKAIGAGLDNPMDACKRRGTDFFENMRKTSEAYAFAKQMNVPLMIGDSGQKSVSELEDAIDDDINDAEAARGLDKWL